MMTETLLVDLFALQPWLWALVLLGVLGAGVETVCAVRADRQGNPETASEPE